MADLKKLFAFIILILIDITNNQNECSKETPIKTISNGCQNVYCDEAKYQNGECIIANSIVKKQWLNDIVIFGEDSMTTYMIEMPNKDNIFISIKVGIDEEEWEYYYPIFYKLELTGEVNLIRELPSMINYLERLNAVGLGIGNTYYPLLCSRMSCFICDLENGLSVEIPTYQLIQLDKYDTSQTMLFTMINTNNENHILFTYLTQETISRNIYPEIHLSKINFFTNINDFSEFETKEKTNDIITEAREISNFKCLMTSKRFIECLYIKEEGIDHSYYVAVYDELLNLLENIRLRNVGYFHPFQLPINGIHLKKEIAAYAYYIDYTSYKSSPLYIQINELIKANSTYIFNNIISERSVAFDNFSDFNSALRVLQEDLIKITDNIFAYAILYPENVIILILFDLYNNDQNLFVRYYKIDLTLYNIVIVTQLQLFNFNSFLGLTFTGKNKNFYELYSFSIIFGYSKKYIDKISLDIHKFNQGFLLEIQKYFKLNNNLFGYELNIKISSISNGLNGIKIFSINENRTININEFIDEEDIILFDISAVNTQIGEVNTINITSIIKSPKYEEFIQLYDKYDPPEVNYSDFYESRIIEEKIFVIELKFSCLESSMACNYQNLTIKTIVFDSYNVILLSNYIYSEEHNSLLSAYLYYKNDTCSNEAINIDDFIYKNYYCLNEKTTDCNNIIEFFSNKCLLDNNGNNDTIRDYIQMFIKREMENGNLDTLINEILKNKNKNLIGEYNNVKYEITTTKNNYNENKNISIVKLGGCEAELKNHYEIDKNEPLIIFKKDIYRRIINTYSRI